MPPDDAEPGQSPRAAGEAVSSSGTAVPRVPQRLSPPIAPPTIPGQLIPATSNQPKWPHVVGIIGIVIGCLSALNGVWQLLTPLYFQFLRGFASQIPPQANMFGAMIQMAWFFYSAGIVMILMAAWQVLAFIGLVRRRPWSPRAVFAWAIVACVVAIALSAGVGLVQSHTMGGMITGAQAAGKGAPMPPFFGSMGLVMGIITAVFTALYKLAFPVFVLIWMSRPAVKEHAKTWPSVPQAHLPDLDNS